MAVKIGGFAAGQAAMEYLMTYGWALLVIVVVIAILVSLNLFSSPQGCSFESPGFVCSSPVIDTTGKLYVAITNANPNNIKLIGVRCTADKSPNPRAAPSSGAGFFNITLLKQATYDVSNNSSSQPVCTRADGSTFASTAGTEFSGKLWVYYKNEEDASNYPVRIVSANIATKVVQGSGPSGPSIP